MRLTPIKRGMPPGKHHYFTIDLQPLYKKIRSQVGGLSTGPTSVKALNSLTNSVIQHVVNEFSANNKGFQLDDLGFNIHEAKRSLLNDDLLDLIDTNSYWLYTEVLKETDKSFLEFPFTYRLLPTGDLMVGVDQRDL